MIRLLVDSIFNATDSIIRMLTNNKFNWDKLWYELSLCNKSGEYPILQNKIENEIFYFTIPIGLSIKDFEKYRIEIATFLKVKETNLRLEYTNNMIKISVFKPTFIYDYEKYEFNNKKGVPIGIDLNTNKIAYWKFDSAEQCHLLIGGATGSGKSVCLDVVINNLMRRKNTELYLQDTKMVDLYKYKDKVKYYGQGKEGIEEILEKLINEMNKRYLNLNKNPNKRYKYIFIVIEELASFNPKEDKTIYKMLGELLAKGRAAKINVILTTQTPYREILPGQLKANLNTKICLKVNTKEASKVLSGDYDALINLKGKGHGKIFTGSSVKEIQCFKIKEAPTAATVDAPDDNKKANNH